MSTVGERQIVDVDLDQVEALLARIEPLVAQHDYDLLKGLVRSYVDLTRLVRERGTTIARLRRLVGFARSEKAADVLGDRKARGAEGAPAPGPTAGADAPAATGGAPGASGDAVPDPGAEQRPRKARKGHGRLPASAYLVAAHIPVPHQTLTAGAMCPECAQGKLYDLKQPSVFVRIVGQPMLAAQCWDCQRLRCGACGAVFTARAPEEAQGPKYDDTAVSMIALLRYGTGMPLSRLDRLQGDLGTPVPSSTQWDVLDEKAAVFKPVFHELERQAAQGSVVHNDDTYVRILEFMGKRRAELLKQGKLPDPERTGLYTTAIVSIADGGRPIVLFYTGRKHAGENLTQLLNKRAEDLSPPILMSDALSRNLPEGHKVEESNCIAHGRRKVVDEVNNFPAECEFVLDRLAEVYKVEQMCRTQHLSDEERLRAHQSASGPAMDTLRKWMTAQFAEKRIEPNSGLGQAFNYMLKRWDKLTLFLRKPGAPLDNNITERALKKAIQQRRNSLFYRSQHGAGIGDMYTSLIHNAELHGENPFEYLTAIQRHAKAVAEDPADWMPWNYRATLARLAEPKREVRCRDPAGPSEDETRARPIGLVPVPVVTAAARPAPPPS
jgi:transposase